MVTSFEFTILISQYNVNMLLTAAMDYLISNPIGNVNIKAFEESCGVGVVILPEQIEMEVEKVLKLNEKELLEKRLVSNYNFILN